MNRHSRRDFLRRASGAAAITALAARPAPAEPPATPAAPGRPNILWITCEDISPDLGCYGDAYAVSPNLDRLAGEGVRFTGAFSISGVCAPSRSALITGMYPTTIGSHHMRTGNQKYQCVPPPEVKCFPEYLRAAGYYCTNDVKTDYQFRSPITAWDDCSRGARWRTREKHQPFFAVVNFTTTHESQLWRIGGNLEHDPAKAKLPPYYPDTPIVRRNWARYHDQITRMDQQAGALLQALAADGLADSTIVFFYSDHGRGLPRGKRWVYDSGIHVPLIVRFPDKRQAGTTDDRLVSFVDFAPTVLSLAGVEIPAHMQGRAFLGPRAGEKRTYVYAARDRMDETYDIIRCVRDKRYKYIRNYQPEKPYAQPIKYMDRMPALQEMRRLAAEGKLQGPQKLFFQPTKPREELYDVTADPHEVNNLAGSEAHAEVLARMRAAHQDWMKRTGDMGLLPEDQVKQRMWPGGKQPATAEPAVAPAGGAYAGAVAVRATCPTKGSSIAYTTEPARRPRWRLYTGPITLTRSATLRVRACRIGCADSPEVSASFRIGPG